MKLSMKIDESEHGPGILVTQSKKAQWGKCDFQVSKTLMHPE
jgi:hypothetical protein